MNRLLNPKSILLMCFCVLGSRVSTALPVLVVGSKSFTESYILGEIIAQIIDESGEAKAERKFSLGGTGIVVESLKARSIDIYPEYSGTIAEAIVKKPNLKAIDELNRALEPMDLISSGRLGFNNTYALAVTTPLAKTLRLEKISDLLNHPTLRAGFSHEFLQRSDGYEGIKKHYGLALREPLGMEHSLTYQSLLENKIDLTEVWSTDAKIAKYNLLVLNDDRGYFPNYDGVLLSRRDLPARFPKTYAALLELEGAISQEKMIELNAKVEIDGWDFARAARFFLNKDQLTEAKPKMNLWVRTKEHVSLVFVSVLFSVLIGLPLGFLCYRKTKIGHGVMALIGLLQTIPSLALLCFLIPVFGIGYVPATVALFLYALLPIVRNTYLGLRSLSPQLIESAQSLALSKWDLITCIELPLAAPSILSGIQISTVISVGTATLAAFIGAGGYGTAIATGLAMNDTSMILQGAIPAAALALIVHGLFEVLGRLLIPEGLRR